VVSTPLADRVGILRPLRIRDFRLLWTAMAVSFLGDGIYIVAIAWQVYRLSNVPSALATVGFAWTLPQTLLLLYSGVLSDRMDRRRLMILGDAVRGVAIGAIGVLSITHTVQMWHIIALVVVYGIGQAIFGPAFSAIVPELVPEERLTEANSLDQFVRPFCYQLMGPGLGGLLVGGLGVGSAFLFDAGTFAFSMAVVFRMTVPARAVPSHDEGRTTALTEMKEGLRYVLSRKWLRGGMFAALVGLLLTWGPFEVLVPFIVKNLLHGSAIDLGLVFFAGGVAAVVIAVVWGQHGLPKHPFRWLYLSWAVGSFAIAGFGVVNAVWQAAVFSMISSAGITTLLVMWFTVVQRYVPADILGRVFSIDWLISASLVPLSFALTGPAASAIGPRGTMIAAGLCGGAVILATMGFLPGVLDPDHEGFSG
jgi:hypothetical protein